MSIICIFLALFLLISLFFDVQRDLLLEANRFQSSNLPSNAKVISNIFEKINSAGSDSSESRIISIFQFISLFIFISISLFAWLSVPAFNAFLVSVLGLFLVILLPRVIKIYYYENLRNNLKHEIPLLALLLSIRGQKTVRDNVSLQSENFQNSNSRESYNHVISDVKDALGVLSNNSLFSKLLSNPKSAFSGSEFFKFINSFDQYSSFSSVRRLKKALHIWYKSGLKGEQDLNYLVTNEYAMIVARSEIYSFLYLGFAAFILFLLISLSMALLFA